MEYRIPHYYGEPVTTERVAEARKFAKTLRRVDFSGRTDISKLDQHRAWLNNLMEAIGHGWVLGENGEVIPVRGSDLLIAHVIATTEVLAEAKNAPPLAIALPRRPAGLTVLHLNPKAKA